MQSQLKLLTDYSITPRYPDAEDLSLENAKAAYQSALEVKKFIESNFLR